MIRHLRRAIALPAETVALNASAMNRYRARTRRDAGLRSRCRGGLWVAVRLQRRFAQTIALLRRLVFGLAHGQDIETAKREATVLGGTFRALKR